jgi:CBS domain-containing protein
MNPQIQSVTVGQVMRQPTTIEPDAHLAAAAYEIEHRRTSALVVVSDGTGEPVAMITSADIVRAVAFGRSLEDTRVNQVATMNPETVRADASAEDAAELMLARGMRDLPVVEDDRLVGMVDLHDLYRVRVTG